MARAGRSFTECEARAGIRSCRALAAAAAIVVAAGCGSPARHGTGQAAQVASAAARGTGGASRALRGELAFIAHGRLFLAGGPAGRLRPVVLPGIPFAPAWSAEHRWLAVEVFKPPPAGQPPYVYLEEPAALWVVGAAGTGARQLTPPSWDVTSFAWSPRADALAAVAYLDRASQARSYLAVTITPAGTPHVIAASSDISGLAWSPDGQRLAAGASVFSRGSGYRSVLELLHPAGGRPAVVTASKGNVLELAGWWPDGTGLLSWLDLQGSASIAADGLPLDSIGLPARRPRQLAWTLAHGSWLAFSPSGRSLAAVSGGDRVIWSGGKHIVICQHTGRCTPISQPAGVVSLDPSWSPDGTDLVFARLSAAGPFGPNGHADFSPSWIRRWQATSSLWLASATGTTPRPLTAAGPGAADPVWGNDGSILFVRNDQLWLLPPGATAAAQVTGPLGALSGPAYERTYYAYIPYPQLIAWTLARPSGTAGTS